MPGFPWALSEENHGSDIVGNETVAVDQGDQWEVSGRKWPIGLYHAAEVSVIHARTAQTGGAADYTLMLLDKRRTPRLYYAHSQTEPLHGVRGLDLGELTLIRCPIPKECGDWRRGARSGNRPANRAAAAIRRDRLVGRWGRPGAADRHGLC